MVNKDLGMVTAYAYAVSKGYTGTEEEFAALMADYAAVGQRAEQAATAAAASATAASGSASDSAASATAAEGFAGNASTSAGNASQAAQSASQSATAASGSATSAAGSATAAAGSATTAGNKATEAAQSATAAAGSATTAGTAATAAQAAQTAAEAAQTAAEDAQAAAETAAASVAGKTEQIDQNTEDISLLKSHLEACEDDLLLLENTESIPLTMNRYTVVYIKSKTIGTDAGGSFYLSSPISVTPGELYRITAEGYRNTAAYAFGNSGTIVDVYPRSYDAGTQFHYVTDELIQIPSGVNQLYVANTTQGESTTPSLRKIVDGDVLRYSAQALTSEEQSIARNNIGAASLNDFTDAIESIADINYVDFIITSTPSKIINSSGVVTDYSGYNDYYVSNALDVTGLTQVIVTCSSNVRNSSCVFYNSSDDVVEIALKSTSGSSTAAYFTNEPVNVPANASYMRLAGYYSEPSAKYADGYTIKKAFAGLKWATVGDSLTEVNSRTTMHYHDYIADETGISVYNMGQSGSGYKRKEDSNNAFYQRVLNIPTDSDVVTIFGSGNDQTYYADSMGTATDTGTETLGGCINTTIDNIYSILPTVQLGIIAPCPWQSYNPVNQNNGMANYTELLRQICANRSIPFLDLYHCSNLRPWDATFRTLAYSKDDGGGTHPDETGHKLLAGRIRVFLDSLIGAY